MLRATFLTLLVAALPSMARAAEGAPLPPFMELRELIRTNAIDVTPQQLDAAASTALLGLVHGKILEAGDVVNEESDAPAIADKRRLDPGCLYVRAGQISLGLAPQLAAVLSDTTLSTNGLGLILDLRFTSGTEYAGAATAADLFATESGLLLDWGTGRADSTAKTNAWTRPVTVLVNRETRGAAEALAAALRTQRAALIIGNRTSGTAAVFRELPLSNGRRLRMAAASVKTGDGQALPTTGLVPDIEVPISPEIEKAYLKDPFTPILTSTNVTAGSNRLVSSVKVRHKVTEADLVRARKAGEPEPDIEAPATLAVPAPALATVRDPVLARAIDLLKGLGVLQRDPKS